MDNDRLNAWAGAIAVRGARQNNPQEPSAWT
jgi:hypothetical protein